MEANSKIRLLAEATVKADGNALLIDSANKSGQWVSIDEACVSGQAFAVEPKSDLIVLDLDTTELVQLGVEVCQFVEASGIPTLLVASGRGGHQHLYVNAGHQRATVLGHLLSMGVPKSALRDNGVRPPLSPHRLGYPVALIAPETVAQALAVLGPPAQCQPLSVALLALIEHGDLVGKYGGRSQVALAIASGMKRAGYDQSRFDAAMSNPDNGGAAKPLEILSQQGEGEFQRFCDRTWLRAWDDATIASATLQQVDKVRVAVDGFQWKTRTGHTDQTVMRALLTVAAKAGTTTPAPGTRALGLDTGLGNPTVTRSLVRLCESGWLVRMPSASKRLATGYQLCVSLCVSPCSDSYTYITTTSIRGTVVSVNNPLHPVFRQGKGLGTTPGKLWSALRKHGPVKSGQLAGLIDTGRQTASRARARLQDHELVESSPDGWLASGDEADLDRIAHQLGIYEDAAYKERAVKLERSEFAKGVPEPVHQIERNDDELARIHGLIAT